MTALTVAIATCPMRGTADPRYLRFGAAAAALVLIIALATVEFVRPLALALIGTQIAVFGLTAFVHLHWSVWAPIFAAAIRPRIGAPARFDDARPARFSQAIGFVLATATLIAFAVRADIVGFVCGALAIIPLILHATTGWSLGSWIYRLIRAN